MLSRRRWSSIDCWLYKLIIAQTCINWIYCQDQVARESHVGFQVIQPQFFTESLDQMVSFHYCLRQLNFPWAIISSINWVINSEYDNMLMRTTQRVDFIEKNVFLNQVKFWVWICFILNPFGESGSICYENIDISKLFLFQYPAALFHRIVFLTCYIQKTRN